MPLAWHVTLIGDDVSFHSNIELMCLFILKYDITHLPYVSKLLPHQDFTIKDK